MAAHPWFACAIVVLSGSLACATRTSVAPAPSAPVKSPAPAPPTAELPKAPPGPPALYKDPVTGAEFVLVKGGCYPMGNAIGSGGPEEKPVHEVCVDDFYLGKFELTQGQWKKVMGSNPSRNAACGDACPVENVSWNDVQAFVRALNGKSGGDASALGPFRLPTEAEWEFAARSGGKKELYAGGGDDLQQIAWYEYTSGGAANPVGRLAANGLGLHDMTGNVWEWTFDLYDPAWYSVSPRANPSGPGRGDSRVLRGGSFHEEAFDLRTSYRNRLPPDARSAGTGFRLLRTVPGSPPLAIARASEPVSSAPPVPPFKDPTTGMELVLVKGGCFQMGNVFSDGSGDYPYGSDNGEEPVHEVCVGDFYIGKFEVTRGQWRAVMGKRRLVKNPLVQGWCDADDCPMGNLAFREAQEFIRVLNAKGGGGKFRLPTEAEWEYAARSGGKPERYAGGNDVDAFSWHNGNAGTGIDPPTSRLHPVGTRLPNGLGLHDMSGNVWEMVNDWFDPTYYSRSPRDNPTGPETGTARTKRGGCSSGIIQNSRTSRREAVAEEPEGLIGFRLARSP